ncbi:hypothetical protein HD553DRAFT_337155 [Filobasidium floriforme]|uniref:uncharacterized protein n=1 Tax=Filobasidium floriforme TaxID=5210 RepID=UPI001E8CF8FC|nr:uncharacterized protein HD553DRAFT_337155 [Filobasidium floriforme]KAH8079622.1 hypothetical protein HD553DRAFT_337155 [Filobasidium floriforme]
MVAPLILGVHHETEEGKAAFDTELGWWKCKFAHTARESFSAIRHQDAWLPSPLELKFRRQFTEACLSAISGKVHIKRFVKKLRDSTSIVVKDVFHTATDFEDPFPLDTVLQAYNDMGEENFIAHKQVVEDLEETPIIPLPPSPAPTSSPAASTSVAALPTLSPAALTSHSTGVGVNFISSPAAATLESTRFIVTPSTGVLVNTSFSTSPPAASSGSSTTTTFPNPAASAPASTSDSTTTTTFPAAAVPELVRAEPVVGKEEYQYLAGSVGDLAEGLQELLEKVEVHLDLIALKDQELWENQVDIRQRQERERTTLYNAWQQTNAEMTAVKKESRATSQNLGSLQQKDQTIDSLQRQVDQLTQNAGEVAAKDQLIQSLQQQLGDLQQLIGEGKAKDEEITSLQQLPEDMNQAISEDSAKDETIESLQNRLEVAASWKGLFEEQEREMIVLQQKVDQHENLSGSMRSKDAIIEEQRLILQAKQNKLEERHAEAASFKTELELKNEAKQKDRLGFQLKERQKEVAKLKTEVESLNSQARQNDQLGFQLDNLETEVGRLQAEAKQNNRPGFQLEEKQKEANRLGSSLHEKQKEVERLGTSLQEKQKAIEQHKDLAAKLVEKQQEVDGLGASLQEKQKEIKAHDNLAIRLNKRDKQLEIVRKEVKAHDALATRLEEKEKQLETLRKDVKAGNALATQLKGGQGAQRSCYWTGGEREQAQSAETGGQTAKQSDRLAQGKGEAFQQAQGRDTEPEDAGKIEAASVANMDSTRWRLPSILYHRVDQAAQPRQDAGVNVIPSNQVRVCDSRDTTTMQESPARVDEEDEKLVGELGQIPRQPVVELSATTQTSRRCAGEKFRKRRLRHRRFKSINGFGTSRPARSATGETAASSPTLTLRIKLTTDLVEVVETAAGCMMSLSTRYCHSAQSHYSTCQPSHDGTCTILTEGLADDGHRVLKAEWRAPADGTSNESNSDAAAQIQLPCVSLHVVHRPPDARIHVHVQQPAGMTPWKVYELLEASHDELDPSSRDASILSQAMEATAKFATETDQQAMDAQVAEEERKRVRKEAAERIALLYRRRTSVQGWRASVVAGRSQFSDAIIKIASDKESRIPREAEVTCLDQVLQECQRPNLDKEFLTAVVAKVFLEPLMTES